MDAAARPRLCPPAREALLDNDAAADHLGVAPRTLEVWRCTRRYKIPYFKVGRLVKYRREDLDAWLVSRAIGVEA